MARTSGESETSADVLRELSRLFSAQAWIELDTQARAAAARYPETAAIYGFVAHAKRQLDELEAGYDWAIRGAAIDPENLFVRNRVSLLANLTGRHAEAYAAASAVVDRSVSQADDAQNLAVTIVNGIYAASRLDKIAEAAERFSPVIERLDHAELHFNSACLYVLARDDRWIAYAAKALGTGKPKSAFADGDFDPIRDDPRFVELLARDWAAEAEALRRSRKTTRAALVPEDFIDPDRCAPGDASSTRDAQLERTIDAAPDDPSGYVVYSDWLLDRGDPLGDFALASRGCDEARTESERMLACVAWAAQLHEHAGRWLGPFAAHLGRRSAATWRHGFVRDLLFDLGYSWRDDLDTGGLLASTLALPMMRFVRSLEIGDIPAGDNEMHYDDVVAALLELELPCLRALAIGPNEYQLSWTHLDASGLAAHFPRLESLELGGGDITIGSLDLPELRRFAIRTGSLVCANLDELGRARWPMLEDLEIWFGSSEYGADEFSGADLAALLGGRGMPNLRRLGLMNAEFTDELCALLVGAPIVADLVELDLSMGTMSDVGAARLAGAASQLAHLARISIADNCVSEAACDELRRLLPSVEVGRQKDAEDRYVSVGE